MFVVVRSLEKRSTMVRARAAACAAPDLLLAENWRTRWTESTWKPRSQSGRFEWTAGKWHGASGNMGIQVMRTGLIPVR